MAGVGHQTVRAARPAASPPSGPSWLLAATIRAGIGAGEALASADVWARAARRAGAARVTPRLSGRMRRRGSGLANGTRRRRREDARAGRRGSRRFGGRVRMKTRRGRRRWASAPARRGVPPRCRGGVDVGGLAVWCGRCQGLRGEASRRGRPRGGTKRLALRASRRKTVWAASSEIVSPEEIRRRQTPTTSGQWRRTSSAKAVSLRVRWKQRRSVRPSAASGAADVEEADCGGFTSFS